MRLLSPIPLLVGALLINTASAEKSDHLKKAVFTANEIVLSLAVQGGAQMKGSIAIEQGSLHIEADQGEYTVDAEGYKTFFLTADKGNMVRMRQKLDGGPDRWVNSVSQKCEYRERDQTAKLVAKAKVILLEGRKVEKTMEAEYLLYDGVKEEVAAFNTDKGESRPGPQRVRMEVIREKNEK